MSLSRRIIVPLALASTLGLAGCPSDDTSDDGASTHEHGAEASTAEHGAEASTAETHDHSVDTNADDPAVVYCSCVFANCHEPYHAKWGEDEMASEAACLMEADALPMNGSDIEMGNFIECRMHFCELAATDPTMCTNALGDAVCM